MKGLKVSLVIITSALISMGLGGMAYAFHSGGVANCDGCHTMHGIYNSGAGSTPSFAGKGPDLLVGSDPSSTCLLCHAGVPTGSPSIGGGPTIMTYPFPLGIGIAPGGFGPGGDFAWLQKTYTLATATSGNTYEYGQTHGHNIVALDFGMTADTDFPSVSPGGGFNSQHLGCDSCHDPHGTYRRVGPNTGGWSVGNPAQLGKASLPISGSGSKGADPSTTNPASAVGTYRLLAGFNYYQGGNINGTLINFPGPPLAVSTSTTGSAETLSTNQVRVAYNNLLTSGVVPWGQWCGTCHAAMLSTTVPPTSTHLHPVDVALASGGEDVIYNSYVSSGVMTGTSANSYLSLVPFMETQSNISTLASHAGLTSSVLTQAGPASTDQVSCPSCHRAHASGFKYALRWDMTSPFITSATQWQVQSENRSLAEANQAYNGRPYTYFGAFQRVLCNKCHAQD